MKVGWGWGWEAARAAAGWGWGAARAAAGWGWGAARAAEGRGCSNSGQGDPVSTLGTTARFKREAEHSVQHAQHLSFAWAGEGWDWEEAAKGCRQESQQASERNVVKAASLGGLACTAQHTDKPSPPPRWRRRGAA